MENHLDKIRLATDFAIEHHKGQTRKCGTAPYISHPIRVMKTVTDFTAGMTDPDLRSDMIIAAVLHDTIEDCHDVDENVIIDRFGDRVGRFVKELTNTSKIDFPEGNRSFRKQKDLERILTISDEMKIVKLHDILDNVTDLKGMGGFAPVFLKEKRVAVIALRNQAVVLNNQLIFELASAVVDEIENQLTHLQ